MHTTLRWLMIVPAEVAGGFAGFLLAIIVTGPAPGREISTIALGDLWLGFVPGLLAVAAGRHVAPLKSGPARLLVFTSVVLLAAFVTLAANDLPILLGPFKFFGSILGALVGAYFDLPKANGGSVADRSPSTRTRLALVIGPASRRKLRRFAGFVAFATYFAYPGFSGRFWTSNLECNRCIEPALWNGAAMFGYIMFGVFALAALSPEKLADDETSFVGTRGSVLRGGTYVAMFLSAMIVLMSLDWGKWQDFSWRR